MRAVFMGMVLALGLSFWREPDLLNMLGFAGLGMLANRSRFRSTEEQRRRPLPNEGESDATCGDAAPGAARRFRDAFRAILILLLQVPLEPRVRAVLLVEMAGIEPASFGTSPGLLRAQPALAFLSPGVPAGTVIVNDTV